LLPEISPALQTFVRAGTGVLMLLTLVWALPHRRRFFLSERWGGYAESRPDVDRLHNPAAYPLILLLWIACCAGLMLDVATVPAAFVNLLLCRYYFVHMRWKGVLRGMGAPGVMSYWLAAVVLLLEFTRRHAPDLQSVALLVAQIDFALIMLSAGIYKWTAGYAQGEGMDLGMVNPMWGYWWRAFRLMSPRKALFRWLNHLAWVTEVAAAVLMLAPHPRARAAGGLLVTVSFLFILTQIRLGWLGEQLMLCGLLFVPPGHAIDRMVASWVTVTPAGGEAPAWVQLLLSGFLWGYIAILPLAYAGLFYNFYARRRLAPALQIVLERYTSFFGLIIWRVFSVDHLNFFIRIYAQRPGQGRTLMSRYGSLSALRFCHVGECIAIATLFTTLKYYPSNPALFEARLRRYARTLECPAGGTIVFEYVAVRKTDTEYAYVSVVEYVFDPSDEAIMIHPLEPGFDVHAPASTSPVREGFVPGSYAPAPR
jgi:hypothetical protein